jgi:hypothetical protein
MLMMLGRFVSNALKVIDSPAMNGFSTLLIASLMFWGVVKSIMVFSTSGMVFTEI